MLPDFVPNLVENIPSQLALTKLIEGRGQELVARGFSVKVVDIEDGWVTLDFHVVDGDGGELATLKINTMLKKGEKMALCDLDKILTFKVS